MNDKALKLDKIFNIFSVLYLPIVIFLFILNIKQGVVAGLDNVHSVPGYLSYELLFIIVKSYLILSIIQIILFFISRLQILYFLISFFNIVLCTLFLMLMSRDTLFFFSMAFAFAFLLVVPIILILFIMWLVCWIITVRNIFNSPDNISQENKNHKATFIKYLIYSIFLVTPFIFMAGFTNHIYQEANKEYNRLKIEAMVPETTEYKLHLLNSEKFYNAIKIMNILPNNKTNEEIAEEIKKELSDNDKYSSILGEYRLGIDEYNTKKEHIRCKYI